ncbi:hypothetical protein GXB85_04725 [Cellulomonas sp. APG4]|uniref:hypothetical protein n=1 Tax=Cellulomonas sp. APG4 TaxID=1538656 RepID=UPI0013796331|nr:hypothetical protein [Cellulomonas sp. APG4]NCT90258.1 hypothetical protein [Cellulomonas sp. APG4]
MPGVLVDIPVATVSLVGANAPQVVQLAVSGLTAGQQVTVTGAAVGHTWPVRGGTVTATTGQVLLTDVLAPLNVPITYTVRVDDLTLVTDPITVPHDAQYVLQSLDGRTVIPFAWHDNDDPRETHLRSQSFSVPGRSTPVVRWDTSGGESGELVVRTTPSGTALLVEHLRDVSPLLVVRTDGTLLDLPPAEHILVHGAVRRLIGFDGLRIWSLRFDVVDDPEPSVVVAVSTVADFNAVYAASTIADFNAEWAGSSVAEFNRTDWTTR